MIARAIIQVAWT